MLWEQSFRHPMMTLGDRYQIMAFRIAQLTGVGMTMLRSLALGLSFLFASGDLAGAAGKGSDGDPAASPVATEQTPKTICALIESAAAAHGIPIDFFTRLIWKESAFRQNAVSPKGAQGIAQFMPATAALRQLVDPFDPVQAIPASAHYLKDLVVRSAISALPRVRTMPAKSA